jgi:hypothetical protein
MRECYQCHERKPLESYTKNKNGPGGLCHYCRDCRRLQQRKYKMQIAAVRQDFKLECEAKKIVNKAMRIYHVR